ncbi:hypothetical protein Pelo_13543 [Pelomyxa schiedti]|nr:hypothetical protein Pelo_13543 [Pelomyxa schiedti]
MVKNPKFAAFVKRCSTEVRGAHSIPDYVAKPFQRLLKYPLLLKEIIKYTSASDPELPVIKEALAILLSAIEKINSNKAHSDSLRTLINLNRSIVGTKQKNLVHPGRTLIFEALLVKIEKKSLEPRKCFLFNDVFLECKEFKDATGDKLKIIKYMSLRYLEVEDVPDKGDLRDALRVRIFKDEDSTNPRRPTFLHSSMSDVFSTMESQPIPTTPGGTAIGIPSHSVSQPALFNNNTQSPYSQSTLDTHSQSSQPHAIALYCFPTPADKKAWFTKIKYLQENQDTLF